MIDITDIANRYIDTWNETDPVRLRALLAEAWAKDACYIDPPIAGQGHDEIAGLVSGVQERFSGFRFALTGGVDGFGDHIRFSWSFGPNDAPDMILGTDFVVLQGGVLKTITGFLDKVPASA